MPHPWLLFIFPFVASLATVDEGAVLFYCVCSVCHGVQRESKLDVRAPSIAHLPNWHVITQIQAEDQ